MKKAVLTGRGLVTPLGTGLETNEKALKNGQSGLVHMPEWKEAGLESQISGLADHDPETPLITKKNRRFTTPNARMAIKAAEEALAEAGLSPEEIKGKRVAVVLGCAGSTHQQIYEGGRAFYDSSNVKKLSPFTVPRVMTSSAVASLSLIFELVGESYDISSACTSGAHAIMLATRLIRQGVYDMVITGGTEEVNCVLTLGFDAMRAISRKYNQTPQKGSRPFDRDRDGFVIASGAGIIVLESEEHALKRGASPISVVSGIAANSNGTDMVVPNPQSSCDVMKAAVEDAGISIEDVNYINTHGTATPTGDPVEMQAIKKLFGDNASSIPLNSTKSMTGHMIGATGAVETIFCSMMLEHGFICPSINLDNPEPEFDWADFVLECRDGLSLRHALNNSFGFGGTNASLVISNPN